MYSHHVSAMAQRLFDAGLIKDGVDVITVFNILHGEWNDKIAVTWCVQDVIDTIEAHRGVTPTHAAAYETLKDVFRKFDANQGINWDTILAHWDFDHSALCSSCVEPDCPECGKELKLFMKDMDGTNQEEVYGCPKCHYPQRERHARSTRPGS